VIDLTDATVRMSPGGNYALITGPQLAELLRWFKDAGLDKRKARPGETAATGEEIGIDYPARVWRTLGLWLEGYFDGLLESQPAAAPQVQASSRLTADELHRISDLLTEIAEVATLLKQKLQQ
jgi:hypothetical protein